MNLKIDYVIGEDWEGMYFNGTLVSEGHSINVLDILDCLKDLLKNRITISNIDVCSYSINDEWLEDEGSMPNVFADIPENVLE